MSENEPRSKESTSINLKIQRYVEDLMQINSQRTGLSGQYLNDVLNVTTRWDTITSIGRENYSEEKWPQVVARAKKEMHEQLPLLSSYTDFINSCVEGINIRRKDQLDGVTITPEYLITDKARVSAGRIDQLVAAMKAEWREDPDSIDMDKVGNLGKEIKKLIAGK